MISVKNTMIRLDKDWPFISMIGIGKLSKNKLIKGEKDRNQMWANMSQYSLYYDILESI